MAENAKKKNKKLETESCVNFYSCQMMFKKEIIKFYKDNESRDNNTFLIDNEQMPIDINKIKKVYSQS